MTFAQPTPDENLVQGWNVQGNFTAAATVGAPGLGFAQAGVVGSPADVTAGTQASAGFPFPPGAANIGSENSASYSQSVLSNGGYSLSPSTGLGQSVVWSASPAIPATTVYKAQPFGTNANMIVAGGTLTNVSYKAFGSSVVNTLGTGDGTYAIPPGAQVQFTYSVIPTSVTFVSTGL